MAHRPPPPPPPPPSPRGAWPALERALQAVPPRSLRDLRPPPRGGLALRCTLPACARCADFRPHRARFEAALGAARVIPWDCGGAARRALAVRHGVRDLPAYVVLDGGGGVRVVEPPAP